ncbi:hypothetical protein PIIN_09791 [Serendipita indica DSM 11827]|uniref:Secreted protein n=1 Tax=Serendipita indica (strain DSM 11827) TaxID=1109443 RepID=G4TWW0_SERID|nr:hypothetical protein PIIN_09791 [Serendipita indica DSM 11827]
MTPNLLLSLASTSTLTFAVERNTVITKLTRNMDLTHFGYFYCPNRLSLLCIPESIGGQERAYTSGCSSCALNWDYRVSLLQPGSRPTTTRRELSCLEGAPTSASR